MADAATYKGSGKSRWILWDDEIQSLGLRIFPSGHKSFVLRYWIDGRERLMTIGAHGILTVQAARVRARSFLGRIADGGDPLAEKHRQANEMTVGQFAELFIQRHSKIHKRTWKADLRRTDQYLASIEHVRLKALTVSMVTDLHVRLGERSTYEANRSMELLRTMFEKAKLWGHLEASAPNPVRGFKRFKETKRERFLSSEELPRLAAAVEKEESIFVRSAIWLYLLTAARKSELLKLKWADVDFVGKRLVLRETKTGNDHSVYLSDPAVKILLELPRFEGNPFVLPGKKQGSGLTTLAQPWRRIRNRAGIANLRLHDLRRTLASLMAQGGTSLHLIGTILNHRSTETTKIYARFAQSHVQDAMESYSRRLVQVSRPSELAEDRHETLTASNRDAP